MAAALAAALAGGGVARAATFEGLSGWEGDDRAQGYAYAAAGVVVPVGARFALPFRLSGSYLYYRYDSAGATIRVKSPGGSLMGGARRNGAHGSATVLAGGELRLEQRKNVRGGPTSDEAVGGLVVQVDGDLALSRRWRGYLFGNWSGAAEYLYGRGAIRYQATNLDWRGPTSFFMGAEAVRHGNDESDAQQAGAFLEWNLVPRHVSLSLHGGYKEDWSPGAEHRRGGYLGVGAYRRF